MKKMRMEILVKMVGLLAVAGSVQAAERPNVLFVAFDDLRPELGCYGSPVAVTPNLDKLADQGLLFNQAYCQQAICGPSRASVMSGLRPDTSGVVHNGIHLRQVTPELVTVAQHFVAHGYESAYCGKIFHGKDIDQDLSWSRKPAARATMLSMRDSFPTTPVDPARVKNSSQAYLDGVYGQTKAWECMDCGPDQGGEAGMTDSAIATMKEMAKGDKPFFLGVGYKKPHLDWDAPKYYWDLYDRSEIPLAKQVTAPAGGAMMGLHASFELRTREGVLKYGDFTRETDITYKHAYLACVSYVDAQLGRLLKALDEEGLRDNTIVIMWSDHGWHLGDMGIWGKATNYELSTRVPLIISAPGMAAKSRGVKTDALVELIDMYPTLCELAGIEPPAEVEGYSFAPLLQDPAQPWKTAAFSQFPCPALREWAAQPLRPGKRKGFFGPLIEDVEARIMDQMGAAWNRELFEQKLFGYAMRTDRYRLVLWKDITKPNAEPLFVELYDHQHDPDETTNVANGNPELVQTLIAQFNKGWRGNLPK